jgi:hypothetical protein
MLRRVALVRTDVSEELSASFIRVTRIGELGTTLAVTMQKSRTELKSWTWISKRLNAGMTALMKANSNLTGQLSCKCAINWITNPNSVYSHLTCDNIEVATRLLCYN